jgi:hypothetical protein
MHSEHFAKYSRIGGECPENGRSQSRPAIKGQHQSRHKSGFSRDSVVGGGINRKVIPIECVARGYLAGSGWKEYTEHGTVCGIKLPSGLRQCDRLPAPIFTPATKEESGHDQNIDYDGMVSRIGAGLAWQLAAFGGRRSIRRPQPFAEARRHKLPPGGPQVDAAPLIDEVAGEI